MLDGFQVELVAVGVTVPPIPILSLLVAPRSGEGHMISGVFYSECLVGALFACIPVMVVSVVAIVDPDADTLRCSVGCNRHRSNQSGAQEY